MKIKGMDIQLTSDGTYRPETLIINGETAFATLFDNVHGYHWKPSASGNILYYRTESGKEYAVPQKALANASSNPKRISLDNGIHFTDAHDAIREILERNLWDAVVNMMNDDTREAVAAELAPCTEEAFLTMYLELAPENLILG